jgi:hypothetical protein
MTELPYRTKSALWLPGGRGSKSIYNSSFELKSFLGKEFHTSIHHLRIIENPLILGDLLQGLLYPQRRPIGLVSGHSFHHVGHSYDSGLLEDVRPLQPLRITGAIQPLVVLQDDLGHRPGEIDFV